MLLRTEKYGPQDKISITLGDYITLFVGPNNTGKSYTSRALYSILRSCRKNGCKKNYLVYLLTNSFGTNKDTLRKVSKDMMGEFIIQLTEHKPFFNIQIDYDYSREEKLRIHTEGRLENIAAWYIPMKRHLGLELSILTSIAQMYNRSIIDFYLHIVRQLANKWFRPEEAEKKIKEVIPQPLIKESPEFEYFINLFESMEKFSQILIPITEERNLSMIYQLIQPTIIDVIIASWLVNEKDQLNKDIILLFKDTFPEFRFPLPGIPINIVKEQYSEALPSQLVSSGIIQILPILYVLDHVIDKLHENPTIKTYVIIEEPELNLELIRQASLAERLTSLLSKLRKRDYNISFIISTHSEFFTYSVTRWLARNNMLNYGKVYEFTQMGVEERKILSNGKVEISSFSKALTKVFFERELEDINNDT